jgi:hypothetical protein
LPDQSAALRDRLLGEIAELRSSDNASDWAQQVLPTKNRLTTADAKILESAFEERLSALPLSQDAEAPVGGQPPGPAEPLEPTTSDVEHSKANDTPGHDQPAGNGGGVLAITAPRRYRDRDHLRYVAKQPCLVCGRKPSDPHHLRYLQPKALGRRASDEFAVPLCRIHHRLVHRVGNEAAWWKDVGIDPVTVAQRLWKHARIEDGRIEPVRPTSESAAAQLATSHGEAIPSEATDRQAV